MTKCPNCGGSNDDEAVYCQHCNRLLGATGFRAPEPGRITLVDIDIPFGAMVRVMTLWTLASIPAMFIAGSVIVVVLLVLATLFGGLGALVRALDAGANR